MGLIICDGGDQVCRMSIHPINMQAKLFTEISPWLLTQQAVALALGQGNAAASDEGERKELTAR